MGVSENSGTTKSSILIGFSGFPMIFTIHFGVPLFLEFHPYDPFQKGHAAWSLSFGFSRFESPQIRAPHKPAMNSDFPERLSARHVSLRKSSRRQVHMSSWLVVSNIFYFQPYLGTWSSGLKPPTR